MSFTNEHDLETLRLEWETSENLLAQSQKDNKEKHNLIESYKLYVKELEKLLEASCGPTWRVSPRPTWLTQDDHTFTPLSTSAPVTTSSTPLPKPTPSSLRYSTSVSLSNKKSRRLVNRHASHQVDIRQLDSLREVPTENLNDSTPTGAMRRLQGKASEVAPLLNKKDERHDCNQAVRILLDELEQSLARKEATLKLLSEEAREDCRRLDEVVL